MTDPNHYSALRSMAEGLANTGVDTAAMTIGAVVGGGVLLVGAALFVFARYRKRHEERR